MVNHSTTTHFQRESEPYPYQTPIYLGAPSPVPGYAQIGPNRVQKGTLYISQNEATFFYLEIYTYNKKSHFGGVVFADATKILRHKKYVQCLQTTTSRLIRIPGYLLLASNVLNVVMVCQ